jgi:hypothetical protein
MGWHVRMVDSCIESEVLNRRERRNRGAFSVASAIRLSLHIGNGTNKVIRIRMKKRSRYTFDLM